MAYKRSFHVPAIRSLVISHKLLGTPERLVIRHTDCDMETATIDEKGWHDVGSSPTRQLVTLSLG